MRTGAALQPASFLSSCYWNAGQPAVCRPPECLCFMLSQIGTRHYMAPELFAHDESPSLDLVDRTDCWWVLCMGRNTP